MSTRDFLNKYSPMKLAPDALAGPPSGLRRFAPPIPFEVMTFIEMLFYAGTVIPDGANAMWLVRQGDNTAFRYALDGSAEGKTLSGMFLHAGTQPLILVTRQMMDALVLEGPGAGPGFWYAVQFFTGRIGSRK